MAAASRAARFERRLAQSSCPLSSAAHSGHDSPREALQLRLGPSPVSAPRGQPTALDVPSTCALKPQIISENIRRIGSNILSVHQSRGQVRENETRAEPIFRIQAGMEPPPPRVAFDDRRVETGLYCGGGNRRPNLWAAVPAGIPAPASSGLAFLAVKGSWALLARVRGPKCECPKTGSSEKGRPPRPLYRHRQRRGRCHQKETVSSLGNQGRPCPCPCLEHLWPCP